MAPSAALVALAALGVVGAPQAAAEPLPYGPDTCIQGFVWREARPGDTVCVTPGVRGRTAAENANPQANRQLGGGPYGPDTCVQGFVWRDAFPGDHICVTTSVRTEAAQDNQAAPSRKQANQPKPPEPKPLQGPAVSWQPRPGGLTAHITDRSGVDAQCTYRSDWYTRGFFLPKNTTFDLVIVPAIPKFQNWNIEIACDNGTKTQTSTFF
ncbi:MAG: hypothetical protein ABWY45_26140 [Mycobacterium sp.]